MTNRLSKIMCWPVLLASFIIAGCGQEYKQEVTGPTEAIVVDPNVVLPDYVSRAIEASGGLHTWVKTKKIELDAVVTFYQPDGSFYLTEQHHEICPWLNSIRISAQEPQGKFVWQLLNGDFSVLEGSEKLESLPVKVCQRYFAEAMLNIITAPIHFLESEVVFTEMPGPVKKEGQWYHSIERAYLYNSDSPAERYWSKVVFYQSKESSLVDMLWFIREGAIEPEKEKFLAVRGYDYRRIEKNAVYLPTKIETFRTDAGGILQQRTAKIDYYSLKSVE